MTKIKLTGGGRYDPSEDFIYFTAGAPVGYEANRTHRWSLLATNDLQREIGPSPLIEEVVDDPEHKLLLDSGVFWLSTQHAKRHGISMDDALSVAPEVVDDFDWLYERYVDVCKRYESQLWGYVEIDQGGAKNKRRTRAKLERLGLRPIPVYHPLVDGWEYFDELAKSYDRICLGNIVMASAQTRVRILATAWERKRRKYPHLWIHALGLTPNESSICYPTNSADSSSWGYAMRFGAPSAPGPFAYLKSFSRFGHDFSYKPAPTVDDHKPSYNASILFQLAQAHFRHRTWRAAEADLSEALDTRPWPAALPGELDPAPNPPKVEAV